MINVIALAVLPALILLFYTYQQDKMQREPVKMVAKGFLFGCLSVFCSFFISVPSLIRDFLLIRIANNLNLRHLLHPP